MIHEETEQNPGQKKTCNTEPHKEADGFQTPSALANKKLANNDIL